MIWIYNNNIINCQIYFNNSFSVIMSKKNKDSYINRISSIIVKKLSDNSHNSERKILKSNLLLISFEIKK